MYNVRKGLSVFSTLGLLVTSPLLVASEGSITPRSGGSLAYPEVARAVARGQVSSALENVNARAGNEQVTVVDIKNGTDRLKATRTILSQAQSWRESFSMTAASYVETLNSQTNIKAIQQIQLKEGLASFLVIRNQLLYFISPSLLRSLEVPLVSLGIRETTRYLDLEHERFPIDFSNEKNSIRVGSEEATRAEWIESAGSLDKRNYRVYLNPKDSLGKKYVLELKRAFAAALNLYDNFHIGIDPLRRDRKAFYRILTDLQGASAVKGTFFSDEGPFLQVCESFDSPHNRNLLVRFEKIYSEIILVEKAAQIESSKKEASTDEDELVYQYTTTYLDRVIQDSFTYDAQNTGKSFMRKGKIASALDWAESKIATKVSQAFALSSYAGKGLTYLASQLFGNASGTVRDQCRSGWMHNIEESQREDISKNLEPLDVLLEKTPFRATDLMIPGHWGHVAIWIGTEKQLKEIKNPRNPNQSFWDYIPQIERKLLADLEDPKGTPRIAANIPGFGNGELKESSGGALSGIQRAIREEHHIIEALRPGVQINTLQHFLDIDDMTALRRKAISDEDRWNSLKIAFEQIGKEYDFNFDVDTNKRIVCSEIAYVVFPEVDWITASTAGRNSITPDQVMELTIGKNQVFEPLFLYHQGQEVPETNPEALRAILKEFSEGKYERVRSQYSIKAPKLSKDQAEWCIQNETTGEVGARFTPILAK